MKKLFIIASLCCLSMTAFAQTEETIEDKPVSPEITALQTAFNLVKYGYANYSASALTEAAKIISATPSQPLEAEVEIGNAQEAVSEKENKVNHNPAQLIADAKKFAGKDKTLLKYIKSVEESTSSVTRGAVGGPKTISGRVNGGTMNTYQISFRAGEWSEVYVSGDGDTNLDLYIYDGLGNLIVCDTGYSDECFVRWATIKTGIFYVRVVNRGSIYNNFILMTN